MAHGGANDDNVINWHDLMTAGMMLGWRPAQVYRTTLPELLIALSADRKARGIKPPVAAMTRDRLNELHERYSR